MATAISDTLRPRLPQGVLCSAPACNPLVSEAEPVVILIETYARMLHHVLRGWGGRLIRARKRAAQR